MPSKHIRLADLDDNPIEMIADYVSKYHPRNDGSPTTFLALRRKKESACMAFESFFCCTASVTYHVDAISMPLKRK
jgi:hypothetical protein